MRRTAAALAAVGFLLVGACGDDDSDSSDASSATGGGDFCDGLKNVYEDMGAGSDEVSEEQGREAIDRLTDLEPPAEIADDWDTFVNYLQSVSGGQEPEQAAVDEWMSATERLNTYAEEECGLTPGDF